MAMRHALISAVALATIVGCRHSTPAAPPAAAPPPRVAAPANTTKAVVSMTTVVRREAVPSLTPNAGRSFAKFQPLFNAVGGPFECRGPSLIGDAEATMVRIPKGIVTYSAAFPTLQDSKATVSVTLGPDGKLLRSGERRGPRMVTGARPGMTPAELQDSLNIARARTPSTMISLDFGRDQALVENTGTPTPGDAIRGPIAVVDALEQLEHPLARAQHVAEVCAHK